MTRRSRPIELIAKNFETPEAVRAFFGKQLPKSTKITRMDNDVDGAVRWFVSTKKA